jgi:substrate import-associated zinc metallohydrolase lipoprotein
MKYLQKLSAICCLILVLASCRKKETLDTSSLPALGGDSWVKGPVDQWIYDSLTKPYNIEVLYRWQPGEVNFTADLVPPKEANVVAAMSAMKQIWIEPYNAETGSDLLIKRLAPKSMILVGSAEYLANGARLLGQAEGGNKIAMYVINEFSLDNIGALREMLHTIQHEFAHILHQNVLYPIDFKSITPQYTSSWFNFTDAQGRAQGFASAYAMSGPDDDFVETVSIMLIEGKNRWEEIVTSQNATAQAALRKKESIVVDYYKKTWNIDFYSLQKRVQDALNRLSPDPVTKYLGFGKSYTTVSVNPASTELTQQAGFTTVFNNAKTGLAAVGGAGRVLDSVALIFNSATTAQLRVYYRNAANSNFQANFTYNVNRDANGIYSFAYVGADGNGGVIGSGVTALINYFANNTFKADWLLSPNNTVKTLRVIFTPQQLTNSAFMGRLVP